WAAIHVAITLPCYLAALPRNVSREPGAKATDALAKATLPLAAPPRYVMPLMAFAFAVIAFVATAMASHLPRLLQDTGASATAAIAGAGPALPAQGAARFADVL